MARNGSGTYSLPEDPFVFDTVIEETKVNANFSDIATEISNSIDKDGQTEITGILKLSVAVNQTANTGSVQGNNPITTMFYEIATCANAGDSCTLPTAVAGQLVIVVNNGANSADIFPASGDKIDGGSVNAAFSLSAGANALFICQDATDWDSLGGGFFTPTSTNTLTNKTLTAPVLNDPTFDVSVGVTAHTGSAQGNGAITSTFVEISTVGTTGDAVTLPSAAAGKLVFIANNGSNSADVFPASGDAIDGASANAAQALAAGSNRIYICQDGTDWDTIGAVGADAVSGSNIADDSIDSEHYVDGSIDAAHIASNAVTTAKINADAVTGAKIADDAIDSEHYADGSIDAAHLASNAVTTVKINADAVTGAKIADDAIDSEHYTDASIDTAHIATNQIDETLMKDAFVGDFTEVTVATGDSIIFGDADGSGNTKRDTVQGVIDLVHGATAGKQTIWIPAAAMRPTSSNGCAAITDVETTAGRPDMQVLDFDKDSDEAAQFQVCFPKSYGLGTVTFQVWWAGLAATTGVAWGLQGVGVPDNSTIDVAYGTAVVVTDDAQGAVEEVLVTAESGAVTIAGTVADNDICFFRIFRDVSDGNDDMAGDARLLGVKLFFTTDAENDA